MGTEPTKRARYHHGDLERAVRDATVAALAEGGVEALSLREVARRVGVSHRAVYRHFEDKRALLAAVATQGYEMLADEMRAAVVRADAEDSIDRLVALGEGYIRFARRERARYEVMLGPRLNEDERFPALETAVRLAVTVLDEELGRAAPQATSKARRDAGIALWSAVHGIASLVLVRRIALKDTHVTRYVDVLLRPVVTGIVQALRA
jgi:AcrR family transcriptional regulator